MKMIVIVVIVTLSVVLTGCSGLSEDPVIENPVIGNETEKAITEEETTTVSVSVAELEKELEKEREMPVVAETETVMEGREITENTETAKIGDSSPVSRAVAAKMLSMAFMDKNDIDALDREITFLDCEADKWYDRYINAAVVSGIMSGGGEEFMPEQALTLYQAQLLLDKLDENNKIKMQITDENRDKPISYALWTDLYLQMLGNLSGNMIGDMFGVLTAVIIPLATPETNSALNNFNMITDTGALSFAGIAMEQYVDQSVKILKKDGEILAVLSVESVEPVIYNAYIVDSSENNITVFSGGAERTYKISQSFPEAVKGFLCDIKISGENALEIVVFAEIASGVIKKTTSGLIEIANSDFESALYSVDKNFKIYSNTDGAVRWKQLSSLIVGTDIARFFVDNGTVKAAVIHSAATPGNIRVSLHTSGFSGLLHSEVSLTSNNGFTVRYGAEEKKFLAGEVFAVKEEADLLGNQRIYVIPNDDGKIILTSVSRSWPDGEKPAYRGVFEIAREEDGFSIVNELSIEQYLYAVVPSEMPSSYGVEAAKVQAVTARSYAYTQFFSNRFHNYGGNVDDSVSCQVYNNIPENNTSIASVNATKGLCLTYNNNVIAANFFSTSAGVTANSGDVWASSTKQFPTSSASYLRTVKQWSGNADFGDLSVEGNADTFFRNTEVDSFDSGFAWFRWNVTMTIEEIAASINKNLKARYTASPKLIKTLQPNGAYLSRDIETVGNLVDVEIIRRGEAGNVLQLKITGSEATVIVSTEYNIRMIIKPVQYLEGADIVLNRVDGSTLRNYSLMPSAFFTLDKNVDEAGNLRSITFFGGGNGHGVGMSQNGVKGMIDAGFAFEDILKHFYAGTDVEVKIN